MRRLALLLPILLLGACAGPAQEPPPASSDQPIPSDGPHGMTTEEMEPWLGSWAVTGIYASPRPDQPDTAPAGQRLYLSGSTATDLAGRSCTRAAYKGDSLSETVFLGLADDPKDETRSRPRPHLIVSCGRAIFGQYLLLADGDMIALADGRALRLSRQGEMHVLSDTGGSAAEQPAAPQGKPTALTAAAPPPAAKAGPALYLASYRDRDSALRGWAILAKAAPLLAKAEPDMVKVAVRGKGDFLRLRAKGLTAEENAEVCRSLTSILPECGVNLRD